MPREVLDAQIEKDGDGEEVAVQWCLGMLREAFDVRVGARLAPNETGMIGVKVQDHGPGQG